MALTISLFLGWIVIGVVHHHLNQPDCEVCKALHHGIADVARTAPTPAPKLAHEPVIVAVAGLRAERTLPRPRGRAPPRS